MISCFFCLLPVFYTGWIIIHVSIVYIYDYISDDSKPKEDDKTTQNEETNASALTGVGGFLSGLTTAVQTTVSSHCTIIIN